MHSLRCFWVAGITLAAGCSFFESSFWFKGDSGTDAAADGSPPTEAGIEAGAPDGADADGNANARDATAANDSATQDAAPESAQGAIDAAEAWDGPVQKNATTTGDDAASATVQFDQPQHGGDLNVVAVGWYGPDATVVVSDSMKNGYNPAIGPNSADNCMQSIYYAPGIKEAGAGQNSVTVTFTSPVNGVDVRILEYSGLNPIAPLGAVSYGSGATSPAQLTVTTDAGPLLFVAGMTSSAFLFDGGSNFQIEELTLAQDMAGDGLLPGAGSYGVMAQLYNPQSLWVLQAAIFH
jgi:hypothetical protein